MQQAVHFEYNSLYYRQFIMNKHIISQLLDVVEQSAYYQSDIYMLMIWWYQDNPIDHHHNSPLQKSNCNP